MTSAWTEAGPWPTVLVLVIAAVGTALSVRPVLAWLPEPVDAAGADKVPYRTLGGTRFVLSCAALAGLATLVSWTALPLAVQPLWMVTSTVGVLLAAIDARTTWLPLALTRLSWVSMVSAAVLAAVLAADPGLLLRAAIGSALAGGVFWLVWRLSRGGIGFGDVRFMPLVGATTAAASIPHLLWGLVLGSLAGAAYGIARSLARRPGPFPYAPPLLLGGYLGAVVLTVT